ncbi:hypothetical protein D3C73_103470 [compost metagenome]
MNVVVIFLIVVVALFVIAFATKRRFGVLGLALAAGAMLSSLWTKELTPLVEQSGVVSITLPPLTSLVAAALVLLPAILLFFSGPIYKDKTHRVLGSLAFAVLALALLLEPLGSALILQDTGKQVYDFFVENRVYIVTAGLVFALFDILATKTPRHHKESVKH